MGPKSIINGFHLETDLVDWFNSETCIKSSGEAFKNTNFDYNVFLFWNPDTDAVFKPVMACVSETR